MRVAMSRLLRSARFDIEACPSGAAFFDSLKSREPDCVVKAKNLKQRLNSYRVAYAHDLAMRDADLETVIQFMEAKARRTRPS